MNTPQSVGNHVTFLGTGNFLAPLRYWNSFVVNRKFLVEPSPSSLANLRRAGLSSRDLEAVFISHFHPDHCFGLPFLALDLVDNGGSSYEDKRSFHIVGPAGVERFVMDMMTLGAVDGIIGDLHEIFDVVYVEADGTDQRAGNVSFRAHEVTHTPKLTCFGYVFDLGSIHLGYSGDTEPCDGLEAIASASDCLILECAEVHRMPTHMYVDAVRDLAARHPLLRIVLTHIGAGVDEEELGRVELGEDFVTLQLD